MHSVVIKIQMFWRKKVIEAIFYLLYIIENFLRKKMLQGPKQMKICCWNEKHIGFRSANAHANCCDLAVNCFQQALYQATFGSATLALYPPVAVTQKHNSVGVSEVRYTDVHTNLNPWVALQDLSEIPVYNEDE